MTKLRSVQDIFHDMFGSLKMVYFIIDGELTHEDRVNSNVVCIFQRTENICPQSIHSSYTVVFIELNNINGLFELIKQKY